MRLLLVEDDRMIGESVEEALHRSGYAVDWVRDAEEAATYLRMQSYDLMLLDLGLPDRDGVEFLAGLRRRGESVPVLILTARDAVSDRVKGLDAGADDYLVKPFDLEELFARIRVMLRRGAGRAREEVSCGALTLIPSTHEVIFRGAPVELSTREFALLHALMSPPGEISSRERLEERLYGWGEEIGSNAVEVHIHALRRKLSRDLIRNIRGSGYKVVEQ